jgi:uncharacterized protein with ParB-like and HNH nuclease domain
MRLPEIQRHYVWRATRLRDLLDSLYRGYREFLQLRRVTLAERMNQFVREKAGL